MCVLFNVEFVVCLVGWFGSCSSSLTLNLLVLSLGFLSASFVMTLVS